MLQHAGTFAEVTGCGAIVIHHARKGTGGDDREMVRGSTALYAAVDRAYKFGEPDTTVPGRIQVTMTPIKFGAGTPMGSIRLELSDAEGLKWVEMPKEEERTTPEKNRELVLAILKAKPAGVAKADLVSVMKGKREAKFEVLAQLCLAELTREFKSGKADQVMLSPGVLP
jgi:hypothetical protein